MERGQGGPLDVPDCWLPYSERTKAYLSSVLVKGFYESLGPSWVLPGFSLDESYNGASIGRVFCVG